jgi:hypothetical protein
MEGTGSAAFSANGIWRILAIVGEKNKSEEAQNDRNIYRKIEQGRCQSR